MLEVISIRIIVCLRWVGGCHIGCRVSKVRQTQYSRLLLQGCLAIKLLTKFKNKPKQNILENEMLFNFTKFMECCLQASANTVFEIRKQRSTQSDTTRVHQTKFLKSSAVPTALLVYCTLSSCRRNVSTNISYVCIVIFVLIERISACFSSTNCLNVLPV